MSYSIQYHAVERFMERSGMRNEIKAIEAIFFLSEIAKPAKKFKGKEYKNIEHLKAGKWVLKIKENLILTIYPDATNNYKYEPKTVPASS